TRPIASFFELHIEQGPILEAEELPIGIVTGAQAQRWYDVKITGSESHAGPTPMTHRKDALLGGSELTLAVEKIALEYAPDGRGTVGTLALTPFSRNVVPGSVSMTVDTRHPDNHALMRMKAQLEAACFEIGDRRGLEIQLSPFWHSPAMPFDTSLINQLEKAAQIRKTPARRLWSGAGHDAVYISSMGIPTAMVFVQTKDGISHNESESIQEAHAIAGCQVMCDVVIDQLFS
ncbi:MAG: hydantoinase/carbamoylase family amidase, partial [Chloroflexota bacterium]